jgi:hypothetical protein
MSNADTYEEVCALRRLAERLAAELRQELKARV